MDLKGRKSNHQMKRSIDELRILFVTRTMHFGGGAERLIFDCYNELKKRNITCGIVILEKSDIYGVENGDFFEKKLALEPHIYYPNVDISLSLSGKNFPDVSEYENVLKTFKPTVIHSHMFLGELLARSILWPNVKYFSHFHDNMHQLRNWEWKGKLQKTDMTDFYEKKILLSAYKKCNNQFIAISTDSMRYAKKVLPQKLKNKVVLLPNAVDLSLFSDIPYCAPEQPFRLVNIGSYVDKKNQSFLIDVIDKLTNEGIDVQLDLLGDGPNRPALQQLIDKKNLQHKVTLHGYVEALPHLKQAHLYVHAANYEPFGLVLIEAMAAGVPVVCLDGIGNRGIVKDGHSGFFLRKPKVDLFANKITEILSDPITHKAFHLNALEDSKKYGIKNYIDRLIDIYQGQ